jgi:polyhydroxyalkanoate synthesis repressor PhaR
MKLEIKKYPNRRYYDATHSRHLTLDEIRSLIQQGYDITVTDAKTGEDITAQLLTQIILELETAKLDSFPVPLLVRLIRVNDQVIKDFMEHYFNQALKSFLDYHRQFDEQVVKAHGLPSVFPSVSAWTEAVFKPIASAFDRPASGSRPQEASSSSETHETTDLLGLIHSLQKQVEELKQDRPQAGTNSRRKRRRAQPPKRQERKSRR